MKKKYLISDDLLTDVLKYIENKEWEVNLELGNTTARTPEEYLKADSLMPDVYSKLLDLKK